MIVVLKKNASVMATANYVLHDKKGRTSDRVAYSECRNLGTDDPHVGAKIIASTLLDRHRLKEQAGLGKGGRKLADRKNVYHLMLSWEDEPDSDQIDHPEMVKAANQALHKLGVADHQAIIVIHDDTDRAHAHIVVSRICHETGRAHDKYKDWRVLSRWAQKYETERGKVVCHNRVLNNEARDRGQEVYGEPWKAHHKADLEKKHRRKKGFQLVKAEQLTKDAELAQKRRDRHQKHAQAVADAAAAYKAKRNAIGQALRRAKYRAIRDVQKTYRVRYEMLRHTHEQQLADFREAEKTIAGKVSNAFKLTDWRGVFAGLTGREKLGRAFGVPASSGARLEALKRAQEAERLAVRRQELEHERSRTRELRRHAHLDAALAAEEHAVARTQIELEGQLEAAAERAEWRTRNAQRRDAYERLRDHERDDRAPSNDNAPKKGALLEGLDDPKQLRDYHAKKDRQKDKDRGRDDTGRGL